jgi:hypothetical protein
LKPLSLHIELLGSEINGVAISANPPANKKVLHAIWLSLAKKVLLLRTSWLARAFARLDFLSVIIFDSFNRDI